MIELVKMSKRELEAYLQFAIENYANEKVKSGNWSEEDSIQRSRESFADLLPNGVDTEDQFLFTIRDNDGGRNVGMIWVGWGKYGDQTSSPWIWDFLIYEQYRGKGYGKEALNALDRELKERGQKKVSLQVFGHNTIAINLYQKSGYKITNIVMSKELDTVQ